jgi:hypothetical protein
METLDTLQFLHDSGTAVLRLLPCESRGQSSTILSPERLPPPSVAQRQLKPLMEQSLASLRRLGEGTFIQGERQKVPRVIVVSQKN